jgi:phage gp45-like
MSYVNSKLLNSARKISPMAENAKIVNIAPAQVSEMALSSGRKIRVKETFSEDIVEIVESEGTVSIKITLTETGPVISVSGAKLEINSTESIKLESKRIEIKSSEQTVIKSEGNLNFESKDEMAINSRDDIVVAGKMVYIN